MFEKILGKLDLFWKWDGTFGFMRNILNPITKEVRQLLEHAEGGHDWFHIERVLKNAMKLAEFEGGDKEVIYLGALLHDIADAKFHDGDTNIGTIKAMEILEKFQIEEELVTRVLDIVARISYKGGHGDGLEKSLELQIVQDADRLDAIGAIGIARTFNYGGFKNRKLYDPELPPISYENASDYYKSTSPTINHFYEKLLLLKDRMNTRMAFNWAEKRHRMMEDYLEQFFLEWDGVDFVPDSHKD